MHAFSVVLPLVLLLIAQILSYPFSIGVIPYRMHAIGISICYMREKNRCIFCYPALYVMVVIIRYSREIYNKAQICSV